MPFLCRRIIVILVRSIFSFRNESVFNRNIFHIRVFKSLYTPKFLKYLNKNRRNHSQYRFRWDLFNACNVHMKVLLLDYFWNIKSNFFQSITGNLIPLLINPMIKQKYLIENPHNLTLENYIWNYVSLSTKRI